ncbi:MAG TPA: ATP-binding protein [Verrucomicrobiae bacterium]|jgi:signal transduction histidine kinase|nr:ATP-binding protein [Verrucomicrobiae bacterium]
MNDEFQKTNGGKDPASPIVVQLGPPKIVSFGISFSFFNSIRWRLQIWYGLILVAVLVGFGVTAFQLEHGRVFRRVDDELQRRVGALASVLHQPRNRRPEGPPGQRPFDGPPEEQPSPENPPPERGPGEGPPERLDRGPREFHLQPQQAALFDESDTNGFYYVVWRRDGQELARSSNAPPGISLPAHAPRPAPAGEGPHPQPPEMRGTFRESALFTPPGDIVLAGRSIAPELTELRRTALRLSGVGAGILLLGLLGGWWLATRAIRPIDDISATAAKISAGDLSQRINVNETESELGRLAGVLNSTFARLDAAFAQQQQFTSDAAHELRTPVTVMLTQTQTTLGRERSAAEYRETLESCQRAAQRMRRLIESLLELARLDAGQQPMKRSRFDLAQTARECVALISPLAHDRRVKILCDLPPLPCTGDPERLAQVITNLLTNAITYNKEDGEVRISGEAKNGFVILTVQDTGVGISAADVPRVFDRFYRADQSRTSGNTGLGLAISKAIVQAHGGEIEVFSEMGVGTVFVVRLPDNDTEILSLNP